MSDYTKSTNFTAKDTSNAIILGSEFDGEYDAIETASATKANKAVPAAAHSVAGLTSTGDLEDTTVLTADLSAGLPISGDIRMTGRTSAPTGWLLCDGTSYTTATYADLFAAIGYTYGGSGANFNVPDMRGRVAVGLDNMGGTSANVITDANADTLGGTYGEETHALTSAEGPTHTHTGTTSSNGAHTHSYGDYNSNGDQGGGGSGKAGTDTTGTTGSNGAHTHTFTTGSSGSGTAHNNVQPSLFINFMIKT